MIDRALRSTCEEAMMESFYARFVPRSPDYHDPYVGTVRINAHPLVRGYPVHPISGIDTCTLLSLGAGTADHQSLNE